MQDRRYRSGAGCLRFLHALSAMRLSKIPGTSYRFGDSTGRYTFQIQHLLAFTVPGFVLIRHKGRLSHNSHSTLTEFFSGFPLATLHSG